MFKKNLSIALAVIVIGLFAGVGFAADLIGGEWEWLNTESWTDATEVVTTLEDDVLSLVISFDAEAGFEKVAAQRVVEGQDWSSLNGVKMDIYNPNDFALQFTVVLASKADGWQEVAPGRMIRPGLSEGVTFRFLDVKSELTGWNLGSPVGLEDMEHFFIYFSAVEEGQKGEVYVDNIELF